MITRRITGLLVCLVGAMTLLSGGCTGCKIALHEGTRANVTQAFARCLKRGNTVVRFHLYIRDNATTEPVNYYLGHILSDSNFTSFRAKGNDTFAPYLWVWARANGKYILRVPLDYHVMSLGIISLYIADMEVPLVTDDLNCTETIPYAEVQNMVATLLNDEVIHASDHVIIEDVISRSAYTMEYYIGRVVGVKGCERNPTTKNFSCESFAYMKGWEMTWFGPAAVITSFYIFIIITIYKEYINYQDIKGKDKNLRIKVGIIEQKILRDVKRIRRQLYGAPIENNFISYLDKLTFLDILGVSQKKQRKIVTVLQIIVSIFLLATYYGIMAYSIYYNGLKRQRKLIELIENSREMYANFFGHLAWLYTSESNPALKTYALVEACFTGMIPLFMLFLFIMFRAATRDVQIILPEKKPRANGNNDDTLEPDAKLPDNIHTRELAEKETKEFGVIVRYANCYHAFANSTMGKVLCVILGCVVIIFWLLLGGVYLIYSLYMIGVGSFLTLNLFAGWMLPACLSVYYSYEVFTPLFELYTASKNAIFTEIHKRGYLVKTDEYMLVPSSIVEKFYYARSRGQLFEGFQRVFVALSLLLMLFLIFIASQYPDFDIRTKNSNLVMGVNIAIILPFLASMMQTRQPLSDFEKSIILGDVQHHLDEWEVDNEAMMEALKIRVAKLQKAAKREPSPDKAAASTNPENPGNNPENPGNNPGNPGNNPGNPGNNAVLPIIAAVAAVNAFDDSNEEVLPIVKEPVKEPAKDADKGDTKDEVTQAPGSTSDPQEPLEDMNGIEMTELTPMLPPEEKGDDKSHHHK